MVPSRGPGGNCGWVRRVSRAGGLAPFSASACRVRGPMRGYVDTAGRSRTALVDRCRVRGPTRGKVDTAGRIGPSSASACRVRGPTGTKSTQPDGFDEAGGVAVDGADNLVVTGSSCDSMTEYCDFRTIKFEGDDGDIIWNVSYDSTADSGPFSEGGLSVAIGSSGDPIVAGVTCSTGTGCDFRVIKYDGADGDVLWNITYNSGSTNYDGGLGSGIAVASDGDAIVTGATCSTSSPDCDFHTMRRQASDGSVVWTVGYVGPGDLDSATGVTIGSDSEPVVVGTSCDEDVCDIRTIKYEQ